MPNGLLADPRGEMRATPRNKLMGLLADGLAQANEFATKPDPREPGKRQNQTLGLLADLVSLGSIAKTADRVSYGEPLVNNLRGTYKPFLKPETADVAMMAPISPRNALAALGMVGGMADNGAMRAATVWHGSPHKFDKFDASKIGTGEGAQAYGHGLYLAESPDVAKTYAPAVMEADVKENLSRMKQMLPSTDGAMRRSIEQSIAEIEGGYNGGQLYKVDLPDDAIAKMLDWDKPVADQSVNELLRAIDWHARSGSTKGADLYDRMVDVLGGQPQATEELKKAGIKGIKYLDGGSRGAGKGSSNFVVFPGNEGLLSILERNGQPLK